MLAAAFNRQKDLDPALEGQGGSVPVLECRTIVQNFSVRNGFWSRKELRAVEGVSLSVNRGEVLAIVGESGCGKTTLARILLGLLRPSQGEVLLKGAPVKTLGRREISRHVQPVFQDPYSSLNPRKTLLSIISLPLLVHNEGSRESRREEVSEIMERVGLSLQLLHRYPGQLSGGQRQRVAIARALVIKPEVIVLDEPTSSLDVSVQAQILNLLMDLRAEFNLTFVLISHNLAVVEHIATHVAVMYLGRVVEQGAVKQVFDSPRHPYTQALLGCILTPEPHLGLPEVTLGAGFPNPLEPPSGCRFHPRCPDVLAICRTIKPPALRDGAGLVECHLFG